MARKIVSDIFRIPFSLWTFLLLYLIVRLVSVSQDVDSRREQFKTALVDVCDTVEESSNFVLGFQKTLATETAMALGNVTNAAIQGGVDSLKSLIGAVSGMLVMVVKFKTNSFRCVTVAGLTMATDAFLNEREEIQDFADTQIGLAVDGINDAMDSLITFLNDAINTVEEYLEVYDSVAEDLAAANINLPRLNVEIPDLDPVVVAPVNFPDPSSWETPDYDALTLQLLNMLDPMQYLQDELNSIPWRNVTTEEIMESLGFNDIPDRQIEFCSRMNLDEMDKVVDGIITAIYVCIGIVAAAILCLFLGETAMVVHHYKKGSYWRPSWYKHGGTLDTLLKHVWYTPSMTCLLVGLLGIAIFKGLQVGTLAAKDSYVLTVLGPLQNETNKQLDVIGNSMDDLSLRFADAINAQVVPIETTFNYTRGNLTASVDSLVNLQATANSDLEEAILEDGGSSSNTLLEMVQCISVILTLPLDDLYDLVPEMTFPRVDDRALTFNRTKAKGFVADNLQKTTYPFDWYYKKLEKEVMFYYYLTAYGAPVFLFGLAFAIYDFVKNKKRSVAKHKAMEQQQQRHHHHHGEADHPLSPKELESRA